MKFIEIWTLMFGMKKRTNQKPSNKIHPE